MQFFSSFTLAALVGLAQAVDVQVVTVGMNPMSNTTALKFWPEKITAKPGSMVQFQFWAGNHTVTQSTFDNPCAPVSSGNASARGIWSGYQPVAASAGEGMIPVYTVTIKDEKPLWLYCSQAKHCQGGMTMVINENTSANSTRSLKNYRDLATTATGGDGSYGGGGSGGGDSGNGGGGSGNGGGDSGNGGGSGDDSSDGGDSGSGNGGDSGSGNGGDSGSGSGSPTSDVPAGASSPASTAPVVTDGASQTGPRMMLVGLGLATVMTLFL